MEEEALSAPVAKLLELGEPKYARDFAWPDYLAYGLGEEHIPALIRIATDRAMLESPDERDARSWAPVHAWRALGQLHAQIAIDPLLRLFHQVPDNDWVIEEMPDVFALIGPAAFPALAQYLRETAYPPYARLVAATGLMQIALANPDLRAGAVQAIAEILEGFKENSPGMNGVLIANLVELSAAEKTELIHRVFVEGKVDRFIVGDWRDIKTRLRPSSGARSPTQPNPLARAASSTPPDPASRPGYKEPNTTSRHAQR